MFALFILPGADSGNQRIGEAEDSFRAFIFPLFPYSCYRSGFMLRRLSEKSKLFALLAIPP